MSISAHEGVNRALAARGTEYRQSGCLEAVYGWFGRPATAKPPGRYLSAIASYRETVKAVGKLPTDWRNAPAGAVHYWDGDPGHVALGTGGGMAVTTNAPQRVSSTRGGTRYALVGEQTVQRIGQGRGRYLGYAMWAFDQNISTADLAGSNATPMEEDDMTPEERQMLKDIRTTQVEDSNRMRSGLFLQVNDIQLRVASMHAGSFLPVKGVKDAPSGDLGWFDKKLADGISVGVQQVLAAIPASVDVDEEQIAAAVRDGVSNALQSITTTVTLAELPGASDGTAAELKPA